MKPLLGLCVIVLLRTCGISAVDYAVGDVRLTGKTKISVHDKPGILLTIENTGSKAVKEVTITVKAKRRQTDVDIAIVKIEKLEAEQEITRQAVLNRLRAHTDYELLTYAVRYQEE